MKINRWIATIGLAAALALGARVTQIVRNAHASPMIRVQNPGVVELPDLSAFSRVYAVSDVHGMYAAVTRLLRAARIIDSRMNWVAGNSLLVVIGDSIDKGNQSVEVLQLWMSLAAQAPAQGGAVLPLLGNHEAEFLANPGDDRKAVEFKKELHDKGIPLSEVTDPSRPMGGFLRSMPLAARVGRWLFAHSGFYPNMAWRSFGLEASQLLSAGNYNNPFFIGTDSILEAKNWWVTGSQSRAAVETIVAEQGFMGVVFGHQPTGLNVPGSCAISADGHLIKIDNGMAPQAGMHPGSLLAFPRPTHLMGTSEPMAVMIRADGSVAPLPKEVPGAPMTDPDD